MGPNELRTKVTVSLFFQGGNRFESSEHGVKSPAGMNAVGHEDDFDNMCQSRFLVVHGSGGSAEPCLKDSPIDGGVGFSRVFPSRYETDSNIVGTVSSVSCQMQIVKFNGKSPASSPWHFEQPHTFNVTRIVSWVSGTISSITASSSRDHSCSTLERRNFGILMLSVALTP